MNEFGKDIHLILAMINKILAGPTIFNMDILEILKICSPYEDNVSSRTIISYWISYLEIITNDKR